MQEIMRYIISGVVAFLMIGALVVLGLRKKNKEVEALNRELADGRKQYEEIVEENRRLRQIRHDLQKQISIIKKYESAGQEDEIEELTIQKMILEKYSEIAEEKNIKLTVDVDNNAELPIIKVDTVGLISNLLDNAIEACEQCTCEPWIAIRIRRDESNMSICVENAKQKGHNPLISNMETTKTDKELHGYGVRIIREIVQKYDGTIQWEEQPESFRTIIVFNNIKVLEEN